MGFSSLLVLFVLLAPQTEAEAFLAVGEPAPSFDLESLEGERVQLADLKGQPLVLNFWASWCAPCRREMPHFQAVYERYKDEGLQIYGINLGESQVAVADFRRRVGFDFPVLLDLKDEAQTAYRILPIPATFFIDREGTIRAMYQYEMNEAQIEREVQQLLAR